MNSFRSVNSLPNYIVVEQSQSDEDSQIEAFVEAPRWRGVLFNPNVTPDSPEDVILKIEQVILNMNEFLDEGALPCLKSLEHPGFDDDVVSKQFNISQGRVFTSIILVLNFVYTLHKAGRTTTMREVYYFYVTHFRSQAECDLAIRDVAKLLRVPRHCLGLFASPKGWWCGSVRIDYGSREIDGTSFSSMHGMPITSEWIEQSQNHVHTDFDLISDARCILVVEKEGVYNRLSEDRFFERYPCILATGKGYPDLATRAFVHTMANSLHLPVYCLADCNPFGIGVMQTYLCGSRSIGLDGGERYSVPIQWIGLRPSHVEQLRDQLPPEVLQQQTPLDKKRLRNLCAETSPFLRGPNRDWRLEELLEMESRGYKVELEALHWLGMDFLCEWVYDIITNHNSANDDDYEESEPYII